VTREEALQGLNDELERYRDGTNLLDVTAWLIIGIVIEAADASLLDMVPAAVRLKIDHVVAAFRQEGHYWVYKGAEGAGGLRDEGERVRRLLQLIDLAGTSTTWQVFRQSRPKN
jgi:hypothetical protein